MKRLFLALVSMAATASAMAQNTAPPNQVPEPESLLLAGLGLALAIGVTIRRKK